MKETYANSLCKMGEFFVGYKELDEQEIDKQCIENFDKFIDELTSSKDQEVLEELLNFFIEEFELNFEGIIEHLKTEIDYNYSLDQLLQAFYKKFDSLINNDTDIAVEMSMWFLEDDKFEEFRSMFNFVKSPKSDRFLDEFLRWFPDYQEEVDILREDMNMW